MVCKYQKTPPFWYLLYQKSGSSNSKTLQKPIFCSIIRTIFTWCPFASAPRRYASFTRCSWRVYRLFMVCSHCSQRAVFDFPTIPAKVWTASSVTLCSSAYRSIRFQFDKLEVIYFSSSLRPSSLHITCYPWYLILSTSVSFFRLLLKTQESTICRIPTRRIITRIGIRGTW